MSRNLLVILLFLSTLYSLQAQSFSAGPDRHICSGTGAFLGTQDNVVQSSWCIAWSPAESLDDPSAVRPKATPKNTTIYTVTVLTDDWQSVMTDQVTVFVDFGGIKFTPPYLAQGSDKKSKAEVTINPGNEEVTWTIEGASLGCTINPMTGDITPGPDFGKITVRATKVADTNCFAEETIDINEGTKDVMATDLDHPGRVAKDGVDTLYLVGESAAMIKAIPNASGFLPEHPFWYNDGNSYTVEVGDGLNDFLSDPILGDGVRQYLAGSMSAGYLPRVVIIAYDGAELVIDLSPLVNEVTDKIDKVNKFLIEKIKKKFPSVPEFSAEINIASFKYKKTKAEKYNNPGWGYKYTIEGGGSMALSGKVYHPQFTYIWDISSVGIYIGSELYIEPYFEASITGAMIKDPSKADPSWTTNNPIKTSVGGGIRGVLNIVGTGNGYSIEGGGSLACEVTVDLNFYPSTSELKIKFTLSPLQMNTKILIERFIDPKKKWKFFDYTVDLVDKWISPEYLLHTFGEQ